MSKIIENAVSTKNFCTLIQGALPRAQHLREHRPKGDAIIDLEMLKQSAEKAGLKAEYERDLQLAHVTLDSRVAVGVCARLGSEKFYQEHDGLIVAIRNEGEDNQYTQQVSSPVIFLGEAHDGGGGEAGLMMRIQNTKGDWNDIFLPRRNLAGPATKAEAELIAKGLRSSDWRTFLKLMRLIKINRFVQRIDSAGWHGDYYALPNCEIIPDTGEAICTFDPVEGFGRGGKMEGANETLKHIEGNNLLMFSVCISLSAPVDASERSGAHIYGTSSRGKTTSLRLGTSMWGKGTGKSDSGAIQTWDATNQGVQTMASLRNDCILPIDDVKQASPKVVAGLALTLMNGVGRAALRSDGTQRAQRTFNVTPISTGEISIKAYVDSDPKAGPYQGGMSVRWLDIPADAGKGFGVLDFVPDGFKDAREFIDYLNTQSRTNFGHHGRALIECMQKDRDGFMESVHEHAAALRNVLDSTDPQVARVVDRFAFIGAVGLAAAERGVLPWKTASITQAINAVFKSWYDARGGEGSQDGLAAEQAFSSFIFSQPGRFDHLIPNTSADRDRVGRFRRYEGRNEVWIPNEVELAQALGGAERIAPFIERLKNNQSEDWELKMSSDGRPKRDAPKGWGRPKRWYCFVSKAQGLDLASLYDGPQVTTEDGPPMPATRRNLRVVAGDAA